MFCNFLNISVTLASALDTFFGQSLVILNCILTKTGFVVVSPIFCGVFVFGPGLVTQYLV